MATSPRATNRTGKTYYLSSKEAIDLVKLYNDFSESKIKESASFSLAIRRLHLAHKRRRWDDVLLDSTIGLESLFAPNQPELKYKVRIRVATYLGDTSEKREQYFNDVGDIYDLRSGIVHGRKEDISRDKGIEAENVLRKSLIQLLNHDEVPNDETWDKLVLNIE